MEEKPKETSKQTKPPQAEFFTPLKMVENVWYFILKLFANAWFLWSLAVLIPFILYTTFLLPKREPSKKTERLRTQADEKRESYTAVQVENGLRLYQNDSNPKASVNMEERKTAKKRNLKSDMAVFVEKKEKERPRSLGHPSHEGKAALGLPSGTKIQALLENRIVSFNVAAPVMAICPKDVLWKEKIVIPKDSKFLGEANVLKSIDRINVHFDLLIFPDGREIPVRALALSEDGAAGIKGKVEKHRDVKVLKAIGETLLGGATLFVGGRRADPFSLEDQLRLNAAQNLTSQAEQDLRNVRVDESITVEPYIPIQVMLLESI